jgi:predicted heme/steroid binding protein
MTSEKKEFSREELQQHNGNDQPTVYVGFEGEVYDVSESKLWKTGMHMKRHPAGAELTEEIGGAPHGPFEKTAFHVLVLCVPAILVGMVTGPLSWWLNYGAKMTFPH